MHLLRLWNSLSGYVISVYLSTHLFSTSVSQDSIPAALTKDKKRVRGQEVAVHLAWKSTLYVTNFPESADDAFMRDLFGTVSTVLRVWAISHFY